MRLPLTSATPPPTSAAGLPASLSHGRTGQRKRQMPRQPDRGRVEPPSRGWTAEQFWDGRVAGSVTADVVEIDGADHGMFVPGALGASAPVFGQVITAVEDFLDRVVWP
jgi:hypothetical protein